MSIKTRKKAPTIADYLGNVIKYTTKKEMLAKQKRVDKRLFKEAYLKAKAEMFVRDEGKCVFCKTIVSKDHYQTCHIIPKEFEDTHNDVRNLLLSCFYHHKVGKWSMHNHPVWLCEWLKKYRKEQYEYILNKFKEIELKDNKWGIYNV